MIDTKNLFDIFLDCLFKDEEVVDGKPTSEPVYVYGVINNVGFHKERLESHRKEVQEMVDQLADTFDVSDSFLNLCIDKNGNHWGEHRSCEQLMLLAVGLEIMEYQVDPKQAKLIMPSNMPILKRKNGNNTSEQHEPNIFKKQR